MCRVNIEGDPLGVRIRTRRKAIGFSLSDLSLRTGLSRSFISQVERGLTKPSIDSLRMLSAALGVPISKLLQNENAKSQVVRQGEGRILFNDSTGLRYKLLSPDIQRQVMMLMTEIDPSQVTASKPLGHPGEECALIIEGDVMIEFEEGSVELHEGDSIQIASNVPHRIVNNGSTRAIIISAISAPGF